MRKPTYHRSLEIAAITTMRFIIGWHLLYEGITKLFIQGWTSASFLNESKWILEGFSNWIINNHKVLGMADLVNTWGLITIGAGLFLGLFTRLASISGAILLFVYYLSAPPLIGIEYSLPMEGSYLIVNKTLIECAALVVLVFSPHCSVIGLDILFKKPNDRLILSEKTVHVTDRYEGE